MREEEANRVANKNVYIREGVCVEKIPQITQVHKTEKTKYSETCIKRTPLGNAVGSA